MASAAGNPVQKSYLVNEPEGSSVAILLNLDLVDRLERMVADSPDHEIGAILLGHRDDISGRHVVIIDGVEPIASEHVRGPAFTLSPKDAKALSKSLTRSRPPDAGSPVGFFRSHLRKGLYLEEADFSMFRQYFSVSSDVFLAARPEPGHPPAAGFFFEENGILERRTSSVQFPLDRAALEAGGYSLLRGSMGGPNSMPAASAQTPHVPDDDRRRQKLMYGAIGGGLILAAILLVAFLNWPDRQAASSAISLSVERTGNALRLSWDPQASAIERATNGILWISDGDKRKGLELNSASLKSGTYVYTPESSSVDFRLDLMKVLAQGSESVRYVADRGKLSPPPAPNANKSPLAEAKVVASTSGPPAAPEPKPSAPSPENEHTADRMIPVPRQAVISITTQPMPTSKIREWIARTPIVRRFQRSHTNSQAFVPPRTLHEVLPRVPARLARELPDETRVDLKVSLDANGIVREIDLVSSKADERVAKLAADALRQWRFEPARLHDRQVACDLLATVNVRNAGTASLVAQKE